VETAIDAAPRMALSAGVLSALYVLVWILFWRKHPERGGTFRGLWLAGMGMAWTITAFIGAKVTSINYPRIPPPEIPFVCHPVPAGLAAACCLILAFLVLRRAGRFGGEKPFSDN
jgi:hypothetical protein